MPDKGPQRPPKDHPPTILNKKNACGAQEFGVELLTILAGTWINFPMPAELQTVQAWSGGGGGWSGGKNPAGGGGGEGKQQQTSGEWWFNEKEARGKAGDWF